MFESFTFAIHRLTSFVPFQHNSNLEDRIAALLQPEKLSGDNKLVLRPSIEVPR